LLAFELYLCHEVDEFARDEPLVFGFEHSF